MNTLLGTDLSRRRLSSTMRIRLYYPLNEEEEVPPPGTPPLNIPPRLPAREPRQQLSGSRCRTLAEALCVYLAELLLYIFLSLARHVCESVRVCVCACCTSPPTRPKHATASERVLFIVGRCWVCGVVE